MAVAIQSTSTQSWQTATTAVFTKPTGLSTGNLMFVTITHNNNTAWTPPAGWTAGFAYYDSTTTGWRVSTYWKIATSGDAGATDFSFTNSSIKHTGMMYRITGHDATTPINTDNGIKDIRTAHPLIFTATITPSVASCLLLESIYYANSGGTPSGYYITTSNPTWTQQYDSGRNGSDEFTTASATRVQTTSCGNWGCDMVSNCNGVGVITAIAPAAAAGPANLKSYNTNLKANIKSINTNLIANVKSLNTNV